MLQLSDLIEAYRERGVRNFPEHAEFLDHPERAHAIPKLHFDDEMNIRNCITMEYGEEELNVSIHSQSIFAKPFVTALPQSRPLGAKIGSVNLSENPLRLLPFSKSKTEARRLEGAILIV